MSVLSGTDVTHISNNASNSKYKYNKKILSFADVNSEECFNCRNQGKPVKLRFMFINLKEAVFKCPNCMFPFKNFIFQNLADDIIYRFEREVIVTSQPTVSPQSPVQTPDPLNNNESEFIFTLSNGNSDSFDFSLYETDVQFEYVNEETHCETFDILNLNISMASQIDKCIEEHPSFEGGSSPDYSDVSTASPEELKSLIFNDLSESTINTVYSMDDLGDCEFIDNLLTELDCDVKKEEKPTIKCQKTKLVKVEKHPTVVKVEHHPTVVKVEKQLTLVKSPGPAKNKQAVHVAKLPNKKLQKSIISLNEKFKNNTVMQEKIKYSIQKQQAKEKAATKVSALSVVTSDAKTPNTKYVDSLLAKKPLNLMHQMTHGQIPISSMLQGQINNLVSRKRMQRIKLKSPEAKIKKKQIKRKK